MKAEHDRHCERLSLVSFAQRPSSPVNGKLETTRIRYSETVCLLPFEGPTGDPKHVGSTNSQKLLNTGRQLVRVAECHQADSPSRELLNAHRQHADGDHARVTSARMF